jgi:alkanesulfonate monooxygenase SsuD/methylene tetrahydromethanopterin reductase-like flavin-dependent oxidoreductase (luciferase family)
MVPLSVLDLSPVAAGSSGAVALRNSLDLARLADHLGFTRSWVAEHHNLPSIASSAPDIMIGQIAAATERMRVGSGGVMLPNHAPLMVAERFKVLEALFPGRIDLGLGRAPGTDPVTSYALRRRQDAGGDDDFLQRFQELLLFENSAFPEGHPFRAVRAMPQDVKLPPIWLLGSSGYSAQLAGIWGGFSFAHHFADYDPASAMLRYREGVRTLGHAADTLRHSRLRGGLCRHGPGRAAAGIHQRSQLRAAAAGGVSPARKPGGGGSFPLFRGGACPHRPEPCPPVRRHQGRRACAARTVDHRDQGGRDHGHDHDLRPQRTPAVL